ncbi:flagellar biosynthesis anti-sigma factor FlgM [Qipengyuania nanhaisediminis]|uniref:flagellar biosynthesis anti-sigma factor FlgM n=1 Tax=Qipengyuania nanhaisediminis TaxID=604088 RepID=UPI0038B2C440
MPSVELSKLQAVTGPRALSDTDRAAIEARGSRNAATPGQSGAAPGSGVSIEVSPELDVSRAAASPPVDKDRVAEIRNALEEGRFPLVPAQIADAMIAAQISFGIRR